MGWFVFNMESLCHIGLFTSSNPGDWDNLWQVPSKGWCSYSNPLTQKCQAKLIRASASSSSKSSSSCFFVTWCCSCGWNFPDQFSRFFFLISKPFLGVEGCTFGIIKLMIYSTVVTSLIHCYIDLFQSIDKVINLLIKQSTNQQINQSGNHLINQLLKQFFACSFIYLFHHVNHSYILHTSTRSFFGFFLKPRIWVEMKGTTPGGGWCGHQGPRLDLATTHPWYASRPAGQTRKMRKFSRNGSLCVFQLRLPKFSFFNLRETFPYMKTGIMETLQLGCFHFPKKKWPFLLESNFPQGPIGDQICWKRFHKLSSVIRFSDSGQVGFDHSRSLRKPTVDSNRMVKGLKTTTASVFGWKHKGSPKRMVR